MEAPIPSGPSLPLFDELPDNRSASPDLSALSTQQASKQKDRKQLGNLVDGMTGDTSVRIVKPLPDQRFPDKNMQTAQVLAETLKGRGRYRRTYARLDDNQRHQVGQAICSHLLASLRNQVATEERKQTQERKQVRERKQIQERKHA